MNISLRIFKSILVLALLGFAFVADAQPNSYEHHQIPKNDTLVITDLPPGILNIPTLGFPEYGSLSYYYVNNEEVIEYIPQPNFVGIDSFYVQIYNPPSLNIFLGFEVEVRESVVITKRDFVSTTIGSDAILYPLDNDSTSTGNLILHDVSPIFNHGTVQINGDEFKFIPENGFEGITHMSYIACNDFGTCEKGVISVLVHDIGLPSTQSGEVLTTEEVSIPVLLPYPDYTILDSASNGSLALLEDFAYLYTPNPGFSGQDSFSFELSTPIGTSIYSVTADVVDLPTPNNFANDDYLYVSKHGNIVADVLDNDNGNLFTWSLQITNGPTNGAAWLVGNGKIKYVPNTNFEGVDKYTYEVANALGVYETATVYVTVSNFTPGAPSFDLNTYDDTQIYFEYNAPIQGSYFEVVSSPLYGSVSVFNNIIKYNPVPGYSGIETFTLRYCVGNDCHTFDINVEVTPNPNGTIGCIGTDDCVWAGDMNRDGIVDGKDILYLCASGEVGTPRAGGNITWIGQYATPWQNMVNGINKNIKHIDSNGDSLVTQADADVVELNYGKRNKITPQLLPTQQNPLYFNPLTPNPQPGDTVQIEVVMGTTNNPAIDFSGITFQMNYNPTIFDTAWIEFEEHSWLGYDAPIFNYSKIPVSGVLDVAFTRADETSKSGFGKIGKVSIVVDDLVGIRADFKELSKISFTQTNGLTGTGHLTKLNDEVVDIQLNLSDFVEELRQNKLNVYPNPADERITVSTNFYNPMKSIRIMNMLGQVIEIHAVDDTNEVELDVSHLESGIYIIDVEASEGPVSKKLEVFRF